MTSLRLGNRLAPVRFLIFLALLIVSVPCFSILLGWRHAAMSGFDISALVFIASVWPLLGSADADTMRRNAARNDANRGLLLAITVAVCLVILIAVGSELIEKDGPKEWAIALIVVTLMIAWLFSNLVYALHYAHVFYTRGDPDGDGEPGDAGGLDFPGTDEPRYWDFIYFSFTLGMTFQTSDTGITSTQVRRTVTFHCLAAFVFNLGVLAFTINVLGGG